ncbi:MAG TPA: outer membrane protein transport protein [Kofleriaceae bacterium]|nr:outer membrane protein transport protein [Kofleriaceae bacterium]
MKPRLLAVTSILGVASTASAGGLLLPGAGPVSTSRAGASVVDSEDGEALTLNPANIAKTEGTVIDIGFAAIDYFMSFKRNGTYDNVPGQAYSGMPYPTISNNPSPSVAIPGTGFVPVPVIAISSDLGNRIPGLKMAVGLYAPNAYPFRDMNTVNGQSYFTTNAMGAQDFPAGFGNPPPPTRYDVIHQEAMILLPSIVAAYRVLPQLDVGVRFSEGFANLKSSVALWGVPANYSEDIRQDGLVTINASENFIPEFSVGATYRATPTLEFGARYTSELDINAKGTALSINGPDVTLGSSGAPVLLLPATGYNSTTGLPNFQCANGGTMTVFKACLDLALPQTATVGGRWKLLDDRGNMKGDVELDIDWENWGTSMASNYLVTVDAIAATAADQTDGINLKQNYVNHGFQDTYAARLGGSWIVPAGDNQLVLRGGVSYDTAAAKTGWERADIDGAAREMIAAGASYKVGRQWKIDAGLGVILEGTRTDPRTCDPTPAAPGCAGTPGYPAGSSATQEPPNQRQGPDPINPIIESNVQAESPVNEGTYKSHYFLFMLGGSYRF